MKQFICVSSSLIGTGLLFTGFGAAVMTNNSGAVLSAIALSLVCYVVTLAFSE